MLSQSNSVKNLSCLTLKKKDLHGVGGNTPSPGSKPAKKARYEWGSNEPSHSTFGVYLVETEFGLSLSKQGGFRQDTRCILLLHLMLKVSDLNRPFRIQMRKVKAMFI